MIIVDTLRPDHLGCYGYERNTSPSIDSLAESGIMFTNVIAQSSWTLPSVTSIFTGLNVRRHGAGRMGGTVRTANQGIPTLPMIMSRNGFQCFGIFNVYLLSEQLGFNRGFDMFSCDWLGHGRAGESVDEAIRLLSMSDTDEPFFLLLLLFDPHDPYDPPAPFDTILPNTEARA